MRRQADLQGRHDGGLIARMGIFASQLLAIEIDGEIEQDAQPFAFELRFVTEALKVIDKLLGQLGEGHGPSAELRGQRLPQLTKILVDQDLGAGQRTFG
ncbi:MAG: hypothetical protein ACK56I_19515 [bacterium]